MIGGGADRPGLRQQGQSDNPAGIAGWQELASSVLAAGATTIPSVSFPARDLLFVEIRITGYSNLDRPMMQFNGVTTAASYWSRWLYPGTTITPTNQQTAVGGIQIAGNDVSTGRIVRALISNPVGRNSLAVMRDCTGTGVAGTPGQPHYKGGGEWISANRITSMLVVTVGGRTLNAGSSFTVHGRDVF